MENALRDWHIVKNRLQENFLKMATHLSEDEREVFYKYLLLTAIYGIRHNVENAYAVNTGGFREHVIGTENQIDMSNAYRAMRSEQDGTLFLFHNHPNSSAPSIDDFAFFLPCNPLKNMTVCGHIGNLYFIQKGELFYKETEHNINMLLKLAHDMRLKITQQYLRKKGYTVDQIRTASEEIQLECVRSIMEELIATIYEQVKRYGFQCYWEGMITSA